MASPSPVYPFIVHETGHPHFSQIVRAPNTAIAALKAHRIDGVASDLVCAADRDAADLARWANAQALRALGNAVVPQCAQLIAESINDLIAHWRASYAKRGAMDHGSARRA